MMGPEFVNAYVEATIGEPFEWGRNDCCTWVCDFITKTIGRDPMALQRGAYASEAEVQTLFPEGFVQGVIGITAAAGFKSVSFPFDGANLGIVATGAGPALALFSAGRWLVKGHQGVLALPVRAGVLAWSVE